MGGAGHRGPAGNRPADATRALDRRRRTHRTSRRRRPTDRTTAGRAAARARRRAPGTGGGRPAAPAPGPRTTQTRDAAHRPPRHRRRPPRNSPRPDGAAAPVAGRGQRTGVRGASGSPPRTPRRGPRAHGSAATGPHVRRPARAVAGPPEPGLEVRAALHPRRRHSSPGARGCGRRATPVGGGPVRRTGHAPDNGTCAQPGSGTRTARHHLVRRAGRGPADVPRLAAVGARRRRRAVPGTGVVRPQPQRQSHRRGAALGTPRLGARGPDGVARRLLRRRRPHPGRGDDHRRSAARVRRGHGARRRRRQAADRPG